MIDTFAKFKNGLAKTRDSLIDRIKQIAASKSKIDDVLLGQLEEALIGSDVGVEAANNILMRLKSRVKEEKYQSTSQLISLLKDEISAMLFDDSSASQEGSLSHLPADARPYVIMVVGVNGVGKTTTVGKLGYQYRLAGHKVVIGAADTFRAAANEQLEIWAKRAGVEIVKQSQGADPAAVAFDALSSAISKKADVVIIDTAGRLHTKQNLMEELKKIKRVVEKRHPGAPHEVLLVLDATTGQNALQQVRYFTDAVAVNGIVLTKLDGTAKGGIVLAIKEGMRIPVKFIGVGEQIDDLQPFDSKAFVDAIFEGSEIGS